ncbi:MAG: hypothetical protein KatS3mg102_2880 [Planctomycetota bacterium]|nr:MAG: hypothetical protein KatS3mg102_2880 [Planctomycetota bacterium]
MGPEGKTSARQCSGVRRVRARAAASAAGRRGAGRGRPETGFTLVEVMMAMAIIVILMSLALYGLNAYRKRAYEQNTRGLIARIESALAAYYAEFRAYPPDGFDADEPAVRTDGGRQVPIKGSAALVYYLGVPQLKEYEAGMERMKRQVGPFLEFTEGMLSGQEGMALEDRLREPTTEIIDAYGNPIHYDNVARRRDGSYRVTEQSAPGVHTMSGFIADAMHGPDPRAAGGAVRPRNPGKFDLWSHGLDPRDPSDDIGNW